MNEASLSHARRDRACHIAWIPKYRRKVLYQQSRHEVGALVRGLFEREGREVTGGDSARRPHPFLCEDAAEVGFPKVRAHEANGEVILGLYAVSGASGGFSPTTIRRCCLARAVAVA